MNWWDEYTVAGGSNTSTAEAGSDEWWKEYAVAQPEPTPVVESDPLADKYTAMYQEMAAQINATAPKPWDAPEDATELEKLRSKRLSELYGNIPEDKQGDEAYVARIAADLEDIKSRGITPERKVMEERYAAEQDPVSRLINAPVMRGAMTGVANAPSSIAETLLRILPGEGAPSKLADKIGRQRASEAEYQAFLDEVQGNPAALPNTITQMTGEYLPLSVLGVPAAAQVGAKGSNDAYLKSDNHTYALTSGILQGALTYAGGKLAGGTWIDLLSGKVGGKTIGPMLKGFGIESGEEIGQLYAQALTDKGFGVGDGKMPTLKDAAWTLATVLGARAVGSGVSQNVESDAPKRPAPGAYTSKDGKVTTTVQPSVEQAAIATGKAMREFVSSPWPSRKKAADAGVGEVAKTAKERKDLAADIRNRLTGQQFTEQLQAAATSPEEADALVEIYKARAASAGESFDNYVGKRIARVEKTTRDDTAKAMGRTIRQDRRGEIDFHTLKDEGLAIIRVFESQNPSTLFHETAHLFERDLAGDDLNTARNWSGARSGKWTNRAREKFARGFERYGATGEAPTKPLKRVFEKYKTWLTDIYGAIKGTPIDVNISPEMRGVFDRLLTPSERSASQEAERLNAVDQQGVTSQETFSGEAERAERSANILSQDLADRFRGLANQTAIPEAREANYEADVAMGFPDRKKWADAEQRAAQRIQADPTGELARVVERIDQAESTGGTINLEDQEDTALVNRLSDMLAMDLANPESRTLHRKLRFAFRSARSEQARQLGYRDPLAVMDPETRKRKNITDAISEPTPEETEARKAARTPEEHAEVDRAMEERYNRAKEELAKIGIDLDDINSIVADPKKAMIVMDHLRAKGKWSDALFEYWRNSILSGPTTQVTNVIGNTVFGAWNLGPERLAESAVNLFARNKNAATFGEFKYLLGGVMPGVMRGLRNARQSWSLETSALAEELGRDGAFKVDGPRGAIKGKMGRLVRAMGYRPLLAADEFAKSLVVTMEVGAHAYRNGKAQGLEGNDLQNFIQQQTDDLGSVSWSQAFAKAEELTFQGNRGLIAQKLAGSGHKLRQFKGARWVLPFVETPAAIFEQGIKRTPVLGAILDYAEARRSGMNLADAGMTPTLARQLIAMGGLALLWEAVGGDEPWLTGSEVIADSKSRDLSYRARPPMSIRLGDQWYSYARIEPFATAIATTADAVRGLQAGRYHKPFTGLVQQAKEKSYLDGLGDAIDAIQGAAEGDLSATEQWGSKFAASWVPNLYRQTVRSAEGEMDENRMWGKGEDRFKRFLNRTAQQAQIPFVDSQPRFDVWGRPISYNDLGDNAVTSFMFRLASPVKAKDLSTVEQADMALIRWNEKHPDDQEVYSEPQKHVEVGGETVHLSDEQHAQYAELSGQLAQQAVSGLTFDPIDPTATDIRRIKKAITDARKMARENLVPLWTFD